MNVPGTLRAVAHFFLLLADQAQKMKESARIFEEDLNSSPPRQQEPPPFYELPLPFKSKQLAPGEVQKIELFPQMTFRADKLVIADPAGWIVLDVLVGKNSQFVSSGEFPAEIFSASSVGTGLKFEPCFPGMMLSVIVRNDGKAPAVCSGVLIGQAG